MIKKILPLLLIFAFFVACDKKADTPDEGKEKTEVTEKQEAPKEFKYTETPTLDMIPDVPAYGIANGKEFKIETIVIEPMFDKWYIVLADKKFGPTDLIMDCQYLNVELEAEPSSGKVFKRAMETGGGFWQMTSASDPTSTTSLNASNANVIEFTKWEAKPWDPNGEHTQIAGKASGRLAVCYQGFSDYKDSWVAGTFTDVPIRFSGKPPWLEEEAATE